MKGWWLELWVLRVSLQQLTGGEGESAWHKFVCIDITEERQVWEYVALWKQAYNLDHNKGSYFICLSKMGEPKEINE